MPRSINILAFGHREGEKRKEKERKKAMKDHKYIYIQNSRVSDQNQSLYCLASSILGYLIPWPSSTYLESSRTSELKSFKIKSILTIEQHWMCQCRCSHSPQESQIPVCYSALQFWLKWGSAVDPSAELFHSLAPSDHITIIQNNRPIQSWKPLTARIPSKMRIKEWDRKKSGAEHGNLGPSIVGSSEQTRDFGTWRLQAPAEPFPFSLVDSLNLAFRCRS